MTNNWKNVYFRGMETRAYVPSAQLQKEITETRIGKGILKEGELWGQIDDDAPYRPITVIQD